jgi:MFS family permease
MTTLMTVLALVMAVGAAARSTWSPCGLSMLSTITPIGEQARGARFATSATWFVVGGVAGGATLGGVLALVAVGIGALHLTAATIGIVAALAAILAAVSDSRIAGAQIPIHRRQVNEVWLDRFRPWVYGAGFGWQIGSGVVTYIMTAAVYLIAVLAIMTGNPWTALGVGVLFGTVRGLAVLLARGITTPARLASFHRRFAELEPVSRRVIVVMELAVASVVAGVLWPPAAVVVVVAAAIGWAVGRQVHVPEGDCDVPRPGAVSTSPVESDAGLDPVSASEATPAHG